jgi:hypothetical protein
MTAEDRDIPPMKRSNTAQEILAELENDEYRVPFLKAMRQGLEDGARHAMRMYAEMLKLVGAEKDIAIFVVGQLGVPIEHAKRAVELHQQIESMDDAEKYLLCEKFVLDAWRKDPKLRERSMLANGSSAEVVE